MKAPMIFTVYCFSFALFRTIRLQFEQQRYYYSNKGNNNANIGATNRVFFSFEKISICNAPLNQPSKCEPKCSGTSRTTDDCLTFRCCPYEASLLPVWVTRMYICCILNTSQLNNALAIEANFSFFRKIAQQNVKEKP